MSMPAELVSEHMGLVHSIARKLHRSDGADLETLLDYGLAGLEKAAEGFHPARGLKFSTYAVPVIRGSILNGINRAGDHDTRRVRQDRKTLGKLTDDLADFLGREPTIAELAEASGLPDERVGAALLGIQHTPLRPEHESPVESQGPGVAAELSAHLEDLLRRDLRQREILTRRYGLDGHEPMTYEAIAQALGLSRPRVQQLEQAALATLSRHPDVKRLFTAYVESDRARKVAQSTGAKKGRSS